MTGRAAGRRSPSRLTLFRRVIPAFAAAIVILRLIWAHRLAVATAGSGPGVRTDDDVLLRVDVGGQRQAPVTVVFSHGLAARGEMFDAQCRALGDRARLVCFDQRGHGASGWGGYRSATIDRLGRDLEQVMDAAAGDDPVILVGHSMGGMAILAFAAGQPERFRRQVAAVALISTSAGRLATAALPRRVAELPLGRGLAEVAVWGLWLIAPAIEVMQPFRRPSGRRWLQHRLFAPNERSGRALTRTQQTWAGTRKGINVAFWPAMMLYEKPEALAVLGSVPTLVVAGAEDATIPCHHATQMAGDIGDSARLLVVARAGHMVNMTHAAEVNRALLDLLADAAPADDTRSSPSPEPGERAP